MRECEAAGQAGPGFNCNSITAKYRSTAHRDGFNCAKRMISCYSISQERSRKVAYALTTAKTSGNDGLLIVSWWWRKACGCVPWYSSDPGRMGKGFSIQVWTVCDNVTEGANPCCVEGFGGHSQWLLLPQCPNKRKCKVGSSPPGYFNLSWKTREVALQTRRVTAPHVHAVGRVRERHWTTDIKGTVEVEAAEL